jgi:hypothetical protein
MIASIEDRGEPASLCTLASMCIDLALADPPNQEAAFDKADDALQDAVEAVEYFTTGVGYERAVRRVSEYAITARLMQTDLDNWRLAAAELPVANGYEIFLTNIVTASAYANVPNAHAKLAEAMPLLLGWRRHVRTGGEHGWYGRMALEREDVRKGHLANGGNGSWDVGVSAGGTHNSFIAPDRRIQVKLGYVAADAAEVYRAAGITPVSARAIGFDDPVKIILSCINEFDGPATASTFTTAELDGITQRLSDAIEPA